MAWFDDERRPDLRRFNVEEMTWEWWRENVKGSKSKVLVTCRTCGYGNNDTSINSVQKNQEPSCWCNGGARWRSVQGWRRFLNMFDDDRRPELKRFDIDEMTLEWWRENVEGCESKILVTCRTCGYRSNGTSINRVQQGQEPACWCNGGGRWSSEQGWRRCLRWFDNDQRPKLRRFDVGEMTWEWWQESITGSKSKILVTCRACGYKNNATQIAQVQQGQEPACWCNGGLVGAASKAGGAA